MTLKATSGQERISNRSYSRSEMFWSCPGSARVQAIHARSRGTYGAPRIHAELADADPARRAWIRTLGRPDRVERRFEADAPNHLWVADIAYVLTLLGSLYLAIVLDVFSRRVVGWALAEHLSTHGAGLPVAAGLRASPSGRPCGR